MAGILLWANNEGFREGRIGGGEDLQKKIYKCDSLKVKKCIGFLHYQ